MAPKKQLSGQSISSKVKRERKVLSLAEKIKILDLLKSGMSFSEVGRRVGKNESSIRTMKQKEAEIRESVRTAPTTAKMVSLVRDKVLAKTEKALSVWLEDMSQQHIPVDGKIIREKALSLYEHYCEGVEESERKEFKASKGWLASYVKRYSLKSLRIMGESASTDAEAASMFPEKLKKPIEEKGYLPEQVLGNMAQVATTSVINEEPSGVENLLEVRFLVSALESMCQEIAKLKAEVACVAVYEKNVFVVGTERGRSFIGNRKDFQIDFVKFLETERPTRKENTQMPPGGLLYDHFCTEACEIPNSSLEHQSVNFVPVKVKTEPCDDNQPSTSVDLVPVKVETEDPDYYRYSVQGPGVTTSDVIDTARPSELKSFKDPMQQEHSEASDYPEVEVTLEDDEYFPSNKRPKNTVQATDAGATVKRKNREFNFEQPNARITDLRKQVEELFERKYAEATLATGPVVIPYPLFQSNSEDLCVDGLPEGIPFRRPSTYGIPSLERILLAKDKIKFVIKSLLRMSDTPVRKQKHSSDERSSRDFQEWWSERFGMIKKGDKAFCNFCSETVVCRTSSVKRHYETVHKQLCNKSEQEQKEHISQEICNKQMQSQILKSFISDGSNLVAASFEVSKVIVKHGKPLSDGEYVKESWLECAPFLFNSFPEKEKIIQRIKGLPVSSNTIEERILMMGTNVAEQLTKDISSCKFLSICLDVSIDVKSPARLAIIARFCRDDEIREELVNLIMLPEHTTGVEICKAVVKALSGRQVNLSKIVSVTSDGAPSMIAKEAGFVDLLENDVGHPLVGFHCIVHEEALCAEAHLKELEEVMKIVTKVINFISGHSFNKRQFQNLLSEVQSVYTGLLTYNSVRWLSKGSILKCFVECLDEIRLFLTNEKYACQELYDIVWICKLMFFADFSSHLNDLSTKLQGCGKTLDVMFDNIKAFEIKLEVFKRDVENGTFKYFPNLKKHMTGVEIPEKTDIQSLQIQFLSIIGSTAEHFSFRFTQLRLFEETAKFIKYADCVTLDKLNLEILQWIDLVNFEMQLIDLQSSSIWRQKFVDLRVELENIERDRLVTGSKLKNPDNEILKLWNSIPETFNCLKDLAMAILTLFSSTYLCESLFSMMNLDPNYWNGLNDEISATCIALKTTKYKPDIKYLSSLVQQQKSH
ncbi:general transcription factor II-I repeat domain-containing protein 2A-like isoform X2 [Hemitrygon akajei]|uniref:general transcription factor II-I repeat domain-containing protein 2A-like isoform X2 n=1 Tax=Hemitrygon akajei TaxID=2704970 RepID=UPI003BF9E0D0